MAVGQGLKLRCLWNIWGVDHEPLEAPKKACVGQMTRERETGVGRLERETSFMVGRLAVSLTGW